MGFFEGVLGAGGGLVGGVGGGATGFVAGGGAGVLTTGGILAPPEAVLGAGIGTYVGARGGYSIGSAAGRAVDQKLYDWTHAQKQADKLSDGDQSRCGGNCSEMSKTSKKSGKEKANDVPSWAKGQKPLPGENGKDFAGRLLDGQYGPGGWSGTGPTSDYNRLKKYGDRSQ